MSPAWQLRARLFSGSSRNSNVCIEEDDSSNFIPKRISTYTTRQEIGRMPTLLRFCELGSGDHGKEDGTSPDEE